LQATEAAEPHRTACNERTDCKILHHHHYHHPAISVDHVECLVMTIHALLTHREYAPPAELTQTLTISTFRTHFGKQPNSEDG